MQAVFGASWMAMVQEAGAAPAGGGAAPAVAVPGMPEGAPAPAGTTGQPLPAQGSAQPGGSMLILWLLPLMLVFMIVMSAMAGRKEKKKRAELLSTVKKHDKVQMLGGIVGTVIEMNDEEVVLRVEEGRIRFTKSAIQTIVRPASGGEKGEAAVESKPDRQMQKA